MNTSRLDRSAVQSSNNWPNPQPNPSLKEVPSSSQFCESVQKGINEVKDATLEIITGEVAAVIGAAAAMASHAILPGSGILVGPTATWGAYKKMEPGLNRFKEATAVNMCKQPKDNQELSLHSLEIDSSIPDHRVLDYSKLSKTTQKICIQAESVFQKSGINDLNIAEIMRQGTANERMMQEVYSNSKQVILWMETDRQESIDQQSIQGYHTAINFMDQTGKTLKCPGLSHLAQVTRGSLNAFEGVKQLSSLTLDKLKDLGPSAILGPLGMIGSAAISILGLIMKSEDSLSPLMLEKIQNLSDQMTNFQRKTEEKFQELEDHLDQKFDKVFEGIILIIKQQQEVVHAIDQAFRALNKLVVYKTYEIRVELGASIADLQDSVDLLHRLTGEHFRDLLLFKFNDLCAKANNSAAGVGSMDRLPKLLEELSIWSVTHAKAESLTGVAFWKAWLSNPIPQHINTYLLHSSNSSHRLNPILGFLSHYANYVRSSNKVEYSTDLINPHVWYRGIDSFLKLYYGRLKSSSTSIVDGRTEDNLKFIESMIAAGREVRIFIKKIKRDELFWSNLIRNYNTSLQELQKAIQDYVDTRNNTLLNHLNQISQSNENSQINIKELDLTADSSKIEQYIQSFNGRKIGQIQDQIKVLSKNEGTTCLPPWFEAATFMLSNNGKWQPGNRLDFVNEKSSLMPEMQRKDKLTLNACNLTSNRPFYNIKIPRVIQCAEFLGLINFTSHQTSSITGVKVPNAVLGITQPIQRREKAPSWTPPLSVGHINPNQSWTINFRLQVNHVHDEKSRLLFNKSLTFKGDWSGLSPIDIYTDRDEYGYWATAELAAWKAETFYAHKFKNLEEQKRYGNYLVKFIENYWNNPVKRSLKYQKDKSDKNSSDDEIDFDAQEQEKCLSIIKDFFLNMRKSIFSDLFKDKGSELQQTVRKAMEKLDMNAKMIHTYLNLVGKKDEGSEFEKLITSQSFLELLIDDETLQKGLSLEKPFLSELLSKEISVEDFRQLEEVSIDELSPLHPMRLIASGTAYLQALKAWLSLNGVHVEFDKDDTNISEDENAENRGFWDYCQLL